MMTFIKKFESIKKKIAAFDASSVQGKIAMQVNMVDEDCGGAFYVEITDGTISVEPYDYNDRSVMLTLKAADMVALVDKKASLGDLVESGDVTVEGNYDHAVEVLALKKPVAKRTKRPSEKKETAPAKEKTAVKKETAPAKEKTTVKKESTPAKEKKTTKKTSKKSEEK